jgi:hypothetical protein
MKKPTDKQVTEEIKTLKAMKPTVLRASVFGDDHHKAIDAQVAVLEEKLSEDDVYERYQDRADNVRDAASQAAQWMEGESEDGKPSKGWKSLVR